METEDTGALFRSLPDTRARRKLFETFEPLATHLAHRYRNRGVEVEDLEQVAYVGLLNAIDRYDPDYGSRFVSFAAPTIAGEIKRHFRDSGWGASVPRRMKDISVSSRTVNQTLSQQLGRSPTVDEIAAELGISSDDVTDAAALGSAYRPDALDAPITEGGLSAGDTLGSEDPRIDLLIDLDSLAPLLASRPPREQEILRLRFYEDLTQRQIAERMGISQMHVSRILSATLDKLRVLLDA